MPSVLEKIQDLLLPITEQINAYIVDVVLRGERTSKVIEVYVDSDNGIMLDQCTAISRELSEKLDTADLIEGRYRLEVSSPGLERPLKLLRQYHRNIGRVCKVRYIANGKKVLVEGKLEQISENTVIISKNGKQIEIPFSEINETYIIPQIK